jgi:hypothetical protein
LKKQEQGQNFSLKLKERLPNKDLQNQEEGTHTEGTNSNKETINTSSINKSESLSLVTMINHARGK